MEQRTSSPPLAADIRRLRTYRWLANALAPLVTIALAILVFRWTFPWLFSRLVHLWTAEALLLFGLAVPWLLISCAFALGTIKCPWCKAPFARKFHLWIPKTCQSCGYNITAPANAATSSDRLGGRDR
jgi:hypothetical protein